MPSVPWPCTTARQGRSSPRTVWRCVDRSFSFCARCPHCGQALTQDCDHLQIFTYYIARATSSFGLPATRPIYERAIEQLPDAQTAEMCLRFAALERKLGEIDRARAVYAHASQFCDPRVRLRPLSLA